MPQLTIRGISKKTVKETSTELIKRLSEVMESPEDYFTLDVLKVKSFVNGYEADTFPFIEVGWFDRGQEVKDKAAIIIYEEFKRNGVDELEIYFKNFDKVSYYSNDEHY